MPAPAASAPGAAPPGPDALGKLIDKVNDKAADAGNERAAVAVIEAPPVPKIDLWERIRRGFKMPELDNANVTTMTRWYATRPDYIDRMAARAGLYLYHIVEEVERRGLPTELALLPFVESAMQPEALSSAKAAGLWQFIPSTGKIYALEQNHWHDERRHVIESTRAALDYLEKLYAQFGDWQLALAAYNWGEGAVARAIAANEKRKKPGVYTALKMPRETAFYVPKLQAIKNIVREPARFQIALPAIRNQPYFVAVTRSRDIDVELAAKLAGMPLDEFRALNPAFNRPIIPGAATPTILVPADKADTFLSNLAAWEATGQPLASWTVYRLKPTESLGDVAKRAGVSEAQLRDANQIPPRYKLASGSAILIPRDETMDDDIAPSMLEASFSLVPENANLRRLTYRVRRGDTLHSVARKYSVAPTDIKAWNQLRSESLFAGQRLTINVVARPAAPKKTAVKATPVTTSAQKTAGRSAAPAAASAGAARR
jgi:membrane-bound lytic murein transglycosylase D